MEARNMLLGMASKDPTLAQVRPNGLNDTPQFKVNVDREKANPRSACRRRRSTRRSRSRGLRRT
jgi:hypothetical protein